MATTKLTLSADRALIKKAKRVARSRKTSVSAMFARYLDALTKVEHEEAKRLGPVTLKASGIVKFSGKRSSRQVLEESLAEKYGLGP